MGLGARNVQPRKKKRERNRKKDREQESAVECGSYCRDAKKQRSLLPRLCPVEEQIIGITAIMELGQVLA